MPEPTVFLSRKFPPVSIIRPTETEGAAMGALTFLTDDGLFRGQSAAFFEFMTKLARAGRRGPTKWARPVTTPDNAGAGTASQTLSVAMWNPSI